MKKGEASSHILSFPRLRILLPVLFFIGIFGSSIYFWQIDFSNKANALDDRCELYANHIHSQLTNALNERIDLIEIFQNNWISIEDESQLYNQSRFMDQASLYFDVYSGVLGISWINSSGYICWVYPEVSNNPAINRSAAVLPNGDPNQGFLYANATGEIGFSFSRELYRGGRGYTVYYPLIFNNLTTGFLTLIIRTSEIIEEILGTFPIFNEYALDIQENDVEIFKTNTLYLGNPRYVQEFTIRFRTIEWQCILTPTFGNVQSVSPLSNSIIFFMGLFLGGLTAVVLFMLINQINRIRQFEEEKRQMEQSIYQRQKLEALGTMAGGIAHDFNNILMNQSGFVELAELELDDINPSNYTQQVSVLHDYLGKLKEIITKAARINGQILEFSRQSDLKQEFLPIQEVIEKTISILKPTLDKRIIINTEMPPNPLIIKGDSTRMHQILLNIIINAKDAMLEGGTITIRLQERSRSIELVGNQDALVDTQHEIYLQIIDTGTGIPPENIPHLFDPFFTTKPKNKGTGLGLAIVYQAIKRLGGIISITSEIGVGTTVHIILPKYMSQEKITNNDQPSNQVRACIQLREKRILCVEDEENIGNAIVHYFEKYGVTVEHFLEGISALERLKAEPDGFCLAILDINLPMKNGIEIYHEIRKIRKDFPVLFITGYCDIEIPPGDPYILGVLTKPFDQSLFLQYLPELERLQKKS
jgi:signal transduction histidine kinase/CheY-like chemotaxis protein